VAAHTMSKKIEIFNINEIVVDGYKRMRLEKSEEIQVKYRPDNLKYDKVKDVVFVGSFCKTH